MGALISRRAAATAIVAALPLAIAIAGVAQAATLATAAQRSTIGSTSGVLRQSGRVEARVQWAVVSSRGPYAVASVVAEQRYRRTFQPGVLMLHRTGDHWHLLAVLEAQPCRSVPSAVLDDLHAWFLRDGHKVTGRREADGLARLLTPGHACR